MGGTDHRYDVGHSFGFSRFLVVRSHSRTALWSRTLPLQKALRPSQLTERYANKYAKAKRVISRLEEELRELRESGGAHPNASEDEREARTAHTSPRPGCTSGGDLAPPQTSEHGAAGPTGTARALAWGERASVAFGLGLWLPMAGSNAGLAPKVAWAVAPPLVFAYLWGAASRTPPVERPWSVMAVTGGLMALGGFCLCSRLLS